MTCTEVLARLRKPPGIIEESTLTQNYLRFRISPEMTIALGATVMGPGEQMEGEAVEIIASRHPCPGEMDAYERILGDAMAGDATLFAREDYVEEAWRIVDPVLTAGTRIYPYDRATWGPGEIEQEVSPPGGWRNPKATEQEELSASGQNGSQMARHHAA
ncbi:MAG: hypothetical protein WB676_11865 [Bryobacteraceae bacterium]